MAQPSHTTVTIDGEKFDAVSTGVVFESKKEGSGKPEMGSLTTTIEVIVDFHDDVNMPFGTLKKLFELANVVTKEKEKDMKIEFWKDESRQDVLGCYQFKGWISKFATGSVHKGVVPEPLHVASSAASTVNHLLILNLEPVLNQQNFKEIKFTN